MTVTTFQKVWDLAHAGVAIEVIEDMLEPSATPGMVRTYYYRAMLTPGEPFLEESSMFIRPETEREFLDDLVRTMNSDAVKRALRRRQRQVMLARMCQEAGVRTANHPHDRIK